MKKKAFIALGAGFFIIFAVLALFSCDKPIEKGRVEKIRLGFLPDPLSSLLYIANEQGMFKRHGLDVFFDRYEGGAYALNDLLAGKLDVAVATEFALVFQSFKRTDLRALGTISTADNTEIVVRKDLGIMKPFDLLGKRIGVSKGMNTEFLLNSFLSLNGIRSADVQTVDLKPSEILKALSEGKIDAGCFYPPFSDEAKKKLAGKALSWSPQGGQDYFFLMITKEELLKTRPQVVISLLASLLEAEAFLKTHSREALEIVARTLNLTPEAVMGGWSKIRFRVRLDQDLLTLMEDEARWAVRNKLVNAEKPPNYFNFLYLEGLGKLKPEAVGVIH